MAKKPVRDRRSRNAALQEIATVFFLYIFINLFIISTTYECYYTKNRFGRTACRKRMYIYISNIVPHYCYTLYTRNGV